MYRVVRIYRGVWRAVIVLFVKVNGSMDVGRFTRDVKRKVAWPRDPGHARRLGG